MATIYETQQYPSQKELTLKVLFPEKETFKGDVVIKNIPLQIAVGLIPTELLQDLSVDISRFGGGNGRVDAIIGVDEKGSVVHIEPFTDEMRETAKLLEKQHHQWIEAKKLAAIQNLKATHI